MAKSSGLGARFFAAGVDLSGDIGGLSAIGKSRPTKNVTGIDKDGIERIHLRKNGRVEYAAHWNPSGAHVTLSDLPTSDQLVTYCHRATLGSTAASMIGKQINYDGTEAADGGLDFTVQAQSNGFGLEWGQLLTAGVEETTGSGSLDGLDYGATIDTTEFGLQAYLHVFAFDGTSATVAIQDSDDDADTDPYGNVTDAVFAAASAVGTQRLQTDRDQTVKRWLRVNVTGTFTELDFAVMVRKNLAEVLF
jgi:hypothetical protein